MYRDNQAMTGIVVKTQSKWRAVETLGQKDDFILENEITILLAIFIQSLNMNIYLYIMNGKLRKKSNIYRS